MPNIAKIQLSDTIDYQRKRINDALDVINNIGGGISEVTSETVLPTPETATSNLYLIRNHTKYKGAALAALINGIYKITPLKNDVMNANQFIYVESVQLGTGVSLNKCVYLDTTGVWQLANPNNPNKYAQGIVGPYNSIILGGIVNSPGLNLTTGKNYYYDETGDLTINKTNGKVGVALDNNTIDLHLLTMIEQTQEQSDWNQTDNTAVDYIKNKPGVVSKTSNGLTPQLPNESTVEKFLRQDGTWSKPNYPMSGLNPEGGAMTGTLSDVNTAQVRNFTILDTESNTGVNGWLYGVIETTTGGITDPSGGVGNN